MQVVNYANSKSMIDRPSTVPNPEYVQHDVSVSPDRADVSDSDSDDEDDSEDDMNHIGEMVDNVRNSTGR